MLARQDWGVVYPFNNDIGEKLMKRSISRLLPILFAGMFVYAGCAKQEVVKKDEPLVPAVVKQAEIAPPQTASSVQKTQDKPISATVVNSSPLNGSEQKKSQQISEMAATTDIGKALEKIYFDFDSSTLNDTARQTLTRNFEVMKRNSQSRIRVEGHCDERGSDEYNLALGERRAQAAARYLTTMGVPADRLSAISYGKEKPADPSHDEAAWAKNRRDEFIVSK